MLYDDWPEHSNAFRTGPLPHKSYNRDYAATHLTYASAIPGMVHTA